MILGMQESQICSNSNFGNFGVFKICQFWQPTTFANFGNFGLFIIANFGNRQCLPILATDDACQIWQLAILDIDDIC